jgi:hypothetical protein
LYLSVVGSRNLMMVLLLCMNSLFAGEKGSLPETSEDGLNLVPGSRFEVVYTDPESDLSRYSKVGLLDAYIAFDKNWARNMGSRNTSTRLHVTARDIDEMKADLAREFQTVFQNELQCHGYTLSDQVGEDVVIIRPAIIDLYINAPDLPSARPVRSHSRSAGRMTLYLELLDSVTNKLVARIVDRKAESDRSGLATMTNSTTNKAAAARIFRAWAADLSDMMRQQGDQKPGAQSPCSKN